MGPAGPCTGWFLPFLPQVLGSQVCLGLLGFRPSTRLKARVVLLSVCECLIVVCLEVRVCVSERVGGFWVYLSLLRSLPQPKILREVVSQMHPQDRAKPFPHAASAGDAPPFM